MKKSYLRFLDIFDAVIGGETRHEVGNHYKVTSGRVSQICQKVTSKMYHDLPEVRCHWKPNRPTLTEQKQSPIFWLDKSKELRRRLTCNKGRE